MTSQEPSNWLWKTSSLLKYRRNLAEAKQLPAKQMITPESLDPEALPSDNTSLHSALKYAQIGHDAALKLLQSAVESDMHLVKCLC